MFLDVVSANINRKQTKINLSSEKLPRGCVCQVTLKYCRNIGVHLKLSSQQTVTHINIYK